LRDYHKFARLWNPNTIQRRSDVDFVRLIIGDVKFYSYCKSRRMPRMLNILAFRLPAEGENKSPIPAFSNMKTSDT
jgi:hypothetical protein